MKKIVALTLSALLGLAAIAQNFPFPMNESGYKYPYGLTVSNPDNARIQSLFKKWEQAMWDEQGTLGRIKYDDTQYTVSEGIGYGMLIYVYMANATNTQCQDHFDKLWRYYKKFKNSNGLMDWKIKGYEGAQGEYDHNGATDGDLDVAYALCMAAKQWGSDGAINYAKEAETLMKAIYDKETNSHNGLKLLKPGDMWDSKGNPCYFTVSTIGMFPQAQEELGFSTTRDWEKLYNDCHTYLERSQRNGLWPNWTDWTTNYNPLSGDEGAFGWDACRTPWRVAQDYLWFGNTSSKGMIDKTNAFLDAKGIQNNPNKVGFFENLTANSPSGVTIKSDLSYTEGNALWVGTFLISLMCDDSQQSNFDKYYNNLKNIEPGPNTKAGPYYAQTLQVLYLLVASGNAANFYDCDNSSPVVVNPVISSASTDGKTITLTTSKAMSASTNFSGFTVYLDGAAQSNVISSMSVSKNTITLNLKNITIKSSNTVAISYAGEYLQSEQGGTLGAVTKMVVKNTVSGGNTLLADCEDGRKTLLGGTWYSYNGSGTVTDAEKIIVSGGANSTAHAAHLTYSNINDYAGMGFNIQPEDAPYDFSGSKGISFFLKGNAAILEVKTSSITDWSYHIFNVPYHANWTLVTVNWTDLTGPGWGAGNSINFAEENLCSEITNFQWIEKSGSGDFWIDEVTLLGKEIIVSADKKALESAIATANTLHKSATTEKYPQTAIDALYAAIDAASSVNINPKASQTEVDAATTTLKNAINTFKDSEIVPVVDKSELADLIGRADNVLNTTVAGTAAGQYSATLRTKLTTALASSKTTNNNAKATQTEVNTAVANLKTAYNNYMASKVPETETTAVEDVAFTLSVYPNPCVDVLNIEASEEISFITIVSLSGTRKVFEIGSETAQISVAGMQTGVYVAQVTFANGATKTVRFVKK